jgi:hypothetical protein
MLNLFNNQGGLSQEELKEFVNLYESYGEHNWVTEIHLGDGANAKIQTLVNKLTQNMGRLSDRLALTIIELSKRKSQHTEGCAIYAGLVHRIPEAGICTCGYGLQVMKETGNKNELYSRELKGNLVQQIGAI